MSLRLLFAIVVGYILVGGFLAGGVISTILRLR